MADRYLTLDDAAELFSFTPRYLRELIRRHQIPVLKSGRLIRFDATALHALEEALRCRSKSSRESKLGRSPSPVRYASVPARGSEFNNALVATTPSSPPKKQRSSRQKFSAPIGMAGNVAALNHLQRQS